MGHRTIHSYLWFTLGRIFSTRRLSSALLSCILLSTASCLNDPRLRTIFSRQEFVQSQNTDVSQVRAFDDTEVVVQSFTVTGQTSSRSFAPVYQQFQEPFNQVSVFRAAQSNTFYQLNTDLSQLKLDLLLIIDNSGSMENEQILLANNFSSLLDHIRPVDWRIAVVTTDRNNFGSLRGMIRKGDFASPAAEFQELSRLIVAGYNGSGTERHIASLISTLLSNPSGFIRADSLFRVMIVTDEDSCSDGTMAAAANPPRVGNVPNNCRADWDGAQAGYDVLNQVIGAEQAVVYGIYWQPGTPQGLPGVAHQAVVLDQLVQATGGISHSIWSDNYAAVLDSIGQHTIAPFREFRLDYTPNSTPVVVRVNGQVLASNLYTIEDFRIRFTGAYVPPSQAEIVVEYEIGQDPRTQFTLSRAAVAGSIQVTVNGVATQAYTLSANGLILTLANVPPASAVINVSGNFAVPRMELDLSGELPALQSSSVRIGSSTLNTSEFEVDGSSINLLVNHSGLETIQVSYVEQSDLVTQFSLAAVPLQLSATPITVSHGIYQSGSNSVWVNPANAALNETISVSYFIRTRNTRSVPLNDSYIDGTVTVTVDGQEYSSALVTVEQGIANFSVDLPARCQFTFDYTRPAELRKRFAFEDDDIRNIAEVYVNDERLESSEWKLIAESHEIEFVEAPEVGALITVWYQ